MIPRAPVPAAKPSDGFPHAPNRYTQEAAWLLSLVLVAAMIAMIAVIVSIGGR